MSLLLSLISPIYKPKSNLTATTNPTVNDDSTLGYQTGSEWFNQSTTEMYVCISNTAGAAVWEQTSLTIDDLGSMALQNSNAVAITGGAIDGTPIGNTTTSTGKFSTAIIGDPGTEGSGINISGVTYESSFKVSDIDGTNFAQTILHRHSTTLEPLIVGARSNSDTSSHTSLTAGQNAFSVYSAGWLGSNYKLLGSIQIGTDTTGTLSNTSAPGRFVFNVTPDGSVTPAAWLTVTNDKKATFAGAISVAGHTTFEGVTSTGATGTGKLVYDTSPTFTTQITTPTAIKTGATDTNKEYTANSGASITIDPANGYRQTITLTANTTITLASVPSATTNRTIQLELVQDGTGGRTVAWSNITFATTGAVAPAINTAIGASTYITIDGTSSRWVGYAANQNLGITDGSSAASGYIGEVISSTIAIGSATSLTTATAKSITSITLTPGDWMVSGNIGFIAAAGTLPTVLTASISATDNTQATSPNGGAFTQLGLAFTAASTNVLPLVPTRINITSTTTYYLVGTATFTVSTLTAYGSITARRFR